MFQLARTLWLKIPPFFRIRVYLLLIYLGGKFYPTSYPGLQRVPFGLFIRYGRFGWGKYIKPHEPESLALVEKYTDVPAPWLVELFQYRGNSYLVTSNVPGRQVESKFHLFTYRERERLITDLRHCVAQFRQIPNKTGHAIGSALGGPIYDHRIDKTCGPCDSESEFHSSLVRRDDLKAKAVVSKAHSKNHNIYFSHGDLAPSNILVENGRLTGIVDFECSAFLPEYWEYTKALYPLWGFQDAQKPWVNIIDSVFDGNYKEELEAEEELWGYIYPF